MSFSSLSDFILALEDNNELLRVSQYVNPELEMSEIADRFSKEPGGGKALLFENTGTGFPVLINSLGSGKRMCIALGINNLDDVSKDISEMLGLLSEPRQSILKKLSALPSLARYAGFMPKKGGKKPICQEIIHLEPDLNILPVLKTWPFDAGRFITFPMVHTTDPETGTRNIGMYRMQVFDKNTTGMHWHKHKTGASHFEKYKKAGKLMPIAVALGGDPILSYCATAPLPDQLDEYIFAGFLRKKPVRLARAITQDIDVPADADFIIEGYIDPSEDFRAEGPFGDHTGFYSLTDHYPVFHVTCITHKKNAVFPATVVGIPPMEDAWIAKATERIFLWPIKKAIVPEMTDMNIPEFGVAHNLTIASITKSYAGQSEKVMHALWGAGQMMFNKFMVITDEKDQVQDYLGLLTKFSGLDFSKQLVFSRGPLDVLDHSAQNLGFGSKMGIDLTATFTEETLAYEQALRQESIIPEKSKHLIVNSEYIAHRFSGVRILLLNVKKSEKADLINDVRAYLSTFDTDRPRIVIFLDENVDITDYYLTSWVVLNNIDPIRDISIHFENNDQILFLDATSKEAGLNHFVRPWPNIIVMDDVTIENIDKNWQRIISSGFIESPSRKFKKLVLNSGATAKPG